MQALNQLANIQGQVQWRGRGTTQPDYWDVAPWDHQWQRLCSPADKHEGFRKTSRWEKKRASTLRGVEVAWLHKARVALQRPLSVRVGFIAHVF